MNPYRDVFVLFPAQVGFSENDSSPIKNSLQTYKNIYFRRVNIQNYGLSTPAEEFLSTDAIFETEYLTETISDLLRLLTLYKFGGSYFDTDTIAQKVRSCKKKNI